jgi:hypothetical protein
MGDRRSSLAGRICEPWPPAGIYGYVTVTSFLKPSESCHPRTPDGGATAERPNCQHLTAGGRFGGTGESHTMTIARRGLLLSMFAIVEGATGLALLVIPTVLLTLLFGPTPATPEVPVIGRICGAALLAIAVASWGARDENRRHGLVELLVGVTLYNCLATAAFVYSALVLKLIGILLWPALLYHAATSMWCLVVTWRASRAD